MLAGRILDTNSRGRHGGREHATSGPSAVNLSSGDYEETVSDFTISKDDFKLEFTGTSASLSTTFTGKAAPTLGTLLTANYTPSGDIEGTAEISAHAHEATFTGTSATITVS